MSEFRNFELKCMAALGYGNIARFNSERFQLFEVIDLHFFVPEHRHVIFPPKHRNWAMHSVNSKAQIVDGYVQCWGPESLFQHILG